ncbi:GNAT family N-acetyltransferase [uncultured Treponema sp.]|uniref:GNAT family N-acetyltransferase n=1 Tax=uncultured Treponema sp. TaxID=162155 RepID=UPI0025DA4C08|nr:GNAT family N-acetyltransferase [uncultured Treponema sp.]
MVQIRKATASDIDALMKSRCRTMGDVCGFCDDYEFSAEFMEATKEYFLHGDGTTVIATDDSAGTPQIVGNATLCYTNLMPTFSHPGGKRAHLMNVHVEKEFRRKGIARKMIELLIDEAKELGVTEISLDATDDGRKLYKTMGWHTNNEAMAKDL